MFYIHQKVIFNQYSDWLTAQSILYLCEETNSVDLNVFLLILYLLQTIHYFRVLFAVDYPCRIKYIWQ